jgi:hypothetical protein
METDMSPKARVRVSQQRSLYTPQYRRERWRKILGWSILVVAAAMAVLHMLTHLGRWELFRFQDLLVGYPSAAVLAAIGIGLLSYTPRKR